MIRTILAFLPLFTCLGARVTLFTQPCCLKAQVEGVTYNLNNATNITHSVFCPSSCAYQLSGSNNNSEVFCFDTVNNNTLCVAPTPKNERTGRFLRPANGTSKKNVRGPRINQGGIAGYVYEHAYYKGWRGWVGIGKNNFASSWNDYISSLKVNHGCKMTMYEHSNQQGAGVTFIENTPWVGYYWNDKFSSNECTCGYGSHDDWEHCTSSHPCDEGRGDCDRDTDCKPGLTCGRQDNCRFYFSQAHGYADCCIGAHLAVKKQTLLDKCNYSAMKLGGTCTLVKLVDGSYHDAGTYQTGYITSCVRITKDLLCPQIQFLTKLGLMHINTDANAKQFESVDWGLFGAQASVTLTCDEIEFKAELVLTGGSVSIFELQIAIGVTSEIGFDEKTHSVTVKYLGTGITLGGSTGVCVLASCFKVNIYKIFGRSQQGSRMLPCQGQCPEVRVEVLEKQCTKVSGKNETACEWVWTPTDKKALIG